MDLMKEANLDFPQVQCLVQALHKLGHADGMDPREEALIRAFHDGARPDGGPDYATTVKTPFDLQKAKALLKTPQERMTFMHTCFLVAFVDHKITSAERALLDSWGGELGFNKDQLQEIQNQVRDYLVGQLAVHVKNTDAVLDVARKLA